MWQRWRNWASRRADDAAVGAHREALSAGNASPVILPNVDANPRRDERFWRHRSHLESCVGIAASQGLEIGAFDLPFVEAGEGQCEFADFRSTEELAALAGQTPGHSARFVVPVSFDLRSGYDALQRRYDWIAAAHVVEHVPDLIWWLEILASKLNEGGTLLLVVPDKRFTFDYHRRVTTMTDLIEHNRQARRTPSFAQVFDQHYYWTEQITPERLWAGDPAPPPPRNLPEALGIAEAATHIYKDVHCSVFTPESFQELIVNLSAAARIPFTLKDVRPTERGQFDFSAALQLKSTG